MTPHKTFTDRKGREVRVLLVERRLRTAEAFRLGDDLFIERGASEEETDARVEEWVDGESGSVTEIEDYWQTEPFWRRPSAYSHSGAITLERRAVSFFIEVLQGLDGRKCDEESTGEYMDVLVERLCQFGQAAVDDAVDEVTDLVGEETKGGEALAQHALQTAELEEARGDIAREEADGAYAMLRKQFDFACELHEALGLGKITHVDVTDEVLAKLTAQVRGAVATNTAFAETVRRLVADKEGLEREVANLRAIEHRLLMHCQTYGTAQLETLRHIRLLLREAMKRAKDTTLSHHGCCTGPDAEEGLKDLCAPCARGECVICACAFNMDAVPAATGGTP